MISLLAGTQLSGIRPLVDPVQGVVRAVPLPSAEEHVGPIALHPGDETAEALFADLGTVIVTGEEPELDKLLVITALMAPYYALLGEVVSWAAAAGVERKTAADYTASMFRALSMMVEAQTEGDLPAMVRDCMTPGGLNELAQEVIRDRVSGRMIACGAARGDRGRLFAWFPSRTAHPNPSDRNGVMSEKPTYEELEQRVSELEAQLERQRIDNPVQREQDQNPIDMSHKEISVIPIFDEEGNVQYVLENVRDITERKQAEEALRISHERFLTVLDSIDATIYVADLESYEILFMNKHMIESFGRDMTGHICWEVFRGESGPCPHCTNDLLVDETGRPSGVQVWQGRNPMTGKWYINHDRAIEWTDGRLVRLQIATDITDLVRMEEELRRAQRMEAVGTLAGGIAHNINNTLMGIQGRASLMMIDKDPSHPDYEHLKGVEASVRSAADLTRDLLGFAKGGKYEVKPTDLNRLIRHENHLFGQTRKEIRILEKLDEGLWTVEVDQGQIRQALLNLYVNAWQAMPGGGELCVRTENVSLAGEEVNAAEIQPGRYVRISVTDTGIGMDASTAEKVFDPFFTTQEMGKGTGLGLASVYGIVKNHGGCINVQSEKGAGTTFHLYLPEALRHASALQQNHCNHAQ